MFQKFNQLMQVIALLGLVLSTFPAAAQFAYECSRPNGTVYVSQSHCPDGVPWRRIQTDPNYNGPMVTEAGTSNRPSAAPAKSLAELQAACPQEFDYLAANSQKFKWDFKFRLSSLKAKCAATTIDCYWDFDRLHRNGYGGGNLDNIIAVKRQAAAYRAKCGIAEEPKTSMTCSTFGSITTCN